MKEMGGFLAILAVVFGCLAVALLIGAGINYTRKPVILPPEDVLKGKKDDPTADGNLFLTGALICIGLTYGCCYLASHLLS
jgi:hypothetical protein